MKVADVLKVVEKHDVILSVAAGKLQVYHDSMIPEEVKTAISGHETTLAVLVIAWGSRQGLPRIPGDLSLTTLLMNRWPNEIRESWQDRVDDYVRLGVPDDMAKWAAYLQLVDVVIEIDMEIHQPFLSQLKRLAAIAGELKETVYFDPKIMDLKRERAELESWISEHVPASL